MVSPLRRCPFSRSTDLTRFADRSNASNPETNVILSEAKDL